MISTFFTDRFKYYYSIILGMDSKLRSEINIAILLGFILTVALFANFMGGRVTGAAVTGSHECDLSIQCNDNNPCTMDACFGGTCMRELVDECIDGDGCCPSGCSDSDC